MVWNGFYWYEQVLIENKEPLKTRCYRGSNKARLESLGIQEQRRKGEAFFVLHLGNLDLLPVPLGFGVFSFKIERIFILSVSDVIGYMGGEERGKEKYNS